MDEPLEFPWGAEVQYDSAGRWQSIHWTMTGPGLTEALGARAPHVQSTALDAGRRVLLLSDILTVDDSLVTLTLLASREAAGSLTLEALVAGERPLGPDLTVTLQWGRQKFTTPLGAGRARFTGLRRAEARHGLHVILDRAR